MHVVCAGDCGVDRYRGAVDTVRAGGITLNFAAHARRLFPPAAQVSVVTALGTDDHASVAESALESLGVHAVVSRVEGATSVQEIDLEPSGEKIFLCYEQGVLGDYRVGERERRVIASADLLVAPHYRQIDGFFESVIESPCPGSRAVDFADIAENPRTDDVERFLDHIDIAFFGLSTEHGDLIDALEAIARRSGKLFVVTLGAEGSVALGARGRLRRAAEPVPRVVDTTGAGDTFAAGFLAAYSESKDVASALDRGARAAAITVSRLGGY